MKTLITLLALTASTNAFACFSAVDQLTLFQVNAPGVRLVEAQTGDVIRLSVNGPLAPKVKEEIQFDDKVVRLVGKSSLANEIADATILPLGNYVRVLYFRVIGAGETNIHIQLVDGNGKPLSTAVEQSVVATQRPTYRCR